jgi:hypothetical protein
MGSLDFTENQIETDFDMVKIDHVDVVVCLYVYDILHSVLADSLYRYAWRDEVIRPQNAWTTLGNSGVIANVMVSLNDELYVCPSQLSRLQSRSNNVIKVYGGPNLQWRRDITLPFSNAESKIKRLQVPVPYNLICGYLTRMYDGRCLHG